MTFNIITIQSFLAALLVTSLASATNSCDNVGKLNKYSLHSLVRAARGGRLTPMSPPSSVVKVDVACSLENFSTLCTAIQVAGLEDALSSGHWTVFAPTNDAFAKLGDMLDAVLDDTALLADILLFHAIDDVVSSDDLECTGLVEMANHQKSRTVCENGAIYQKGGNNPRNNMPKITSTDVPTCQGFIHVVGKFCFVNCW